MLLKNIARLWLGRVRLELMRLEYRVAPLLGLRATYNRHVSRLVQKTSLFDADYYRECNGDGAL